MIGSAILFAWSAGYAATSLFACMRARRFVGGLWSENSAPKGERPRALVIRPCAGDEPHLRENLASIARIGGFEALSRHLGEDMELARRLRANGFPELRRPSSKHERRRDRSLHALPENLDEHPPSFQEHAHRAEPLLDARAHVPREERQEEPRPPRRAHAAPPARDRC
jgi:hypothetical protein